MNTTKIVEAFARKYSVKYQKYSLYLEEIFMVYYLNTSGNWIKLGTYNLEKLSKKEESFQERNVLYVVQHDCTVVRAINKNTGNETLPIGTFYSNKFSTYYHNNSNLRKSFNHFYNECQKIENVMGKRWERVSQIKKGF